MDDLVTPYHLHGRPFDPRGLYAGRAAFLILGGPSVASLDRSDFGRPGVLTMGVNNSPAVIRPNLWISADPPAKFLRSVWLDPTILKFLWTTHAGKKIYCSANRAMTEDRASDCPGIIQYGTMDPVEPETFLESSALQWGARGEPTKCRSVMLLALRVLYDLGVRTVFLVGADFHQSPDAAYGWGEKADPARCKRNNQLFESLTGIFADLKPVFDAAGFHVYNATPGSKLDVFPHVSLADAMDFAAAEFGDLDPAKEPAVGLYDLNIPRGPELVRRVVSLDHFPGPGRMVADVTLITPTGDRQQAFALCERWMARQTFAGRVQWIIVDDGKTPTMPTFSRDGWTIERIRREPKGSDPAHTLPVNMLEALPRVASDRIIIIEDDDWYSADHVKRIATMLDDADLVGFRPHVYAHVAHWRWFAMENAKHASWCMTGFRKAVLPTIRAVCRRGLPTVDLDVWRRWAGSKRLEMPDTPTCIGLKGLPGRRGTLKSHSPLEPRYGAGGDPGTLARMMGNDMQVYRDILARQVGRPVVYTAIFGRYDDLRDPAIVNPDWDYICFGDKAPRRHGVWKFIGVPSNGDPTRQAREHKAQSRLLFPFAPVTIWHDGNCRLLDDPAKIVDQYRDCDVAAFVHPDRTTIRDELAECIKLGKDAPATMTAYVDRLYAGGWADHVDLCETGRLIRWASPATERFEQEWWSAISQNSKRDQLSFGPAIAASSATLHVIRNRRTRDGFEHPTWVEMEPHQRRKAIAVMPRRRDVVASSDQYWFQRYAEMGAARTVGHSRTNDAEQARVVSEFSEIVRPFIQKAATVLDFGCGPGRWYDLLTSATGGQYFGCDIADVFRPPGGEFERVVDGVIPFGDRRFDLIWTCVTLQHITEKHLFGKVIRQLRQRLAPGGTLIATENVSRNRDLPHIQFRRVETYTRLFAPLGVKVVASYDFGHGEQHAVFVGRKP